MKKLIVLILVLSLCSLVRAQILHPVKWSYAAKKLSNTEAVVFVKATIEESWHIYSVNQKEGGPVKTSFTFMPSNEYELSGTINEPSPITKYESAFSMNVSYFENSVIFQQKVKLLKAPTIVMGTLRFMVCNDHQCLPPEGINFEIPIK